MHTLSKYFYHCRTWFAEMPTYMLLVIMAVLALLYMFLTPVFVQ